MTTKPPIDEKDDALPSENSLIGFHTHVVNRDFGVGRVAVHARAALDIGGVVGGGDVPLIGFRLLPLPELAT